VEQVPLKPIALEEKRARLWNKLPKSPAAGEHEKKEGRDENARVCARAEHSPVSHAKCARRKSPVWIADRRISEGQTNGQEDAG